MVTPQLHTQPHSLFPTLLISTLFYTCPNMHTPILLGKLSGVAVAEATFAVGMDRDFQNAFPGNHMWNP